MARRIAIARKADTRGEPHLVALQLARAADRVVALGTRPQTLRDRGRLADGCAQPLARNLGVLSGDLAALRTGPSTTTTLTIPRTSSTVTTSTLVVRTTTTTTSTTSTTAGPTCGNGRLDRGEQCDGTNLFGRDCKTLGFAGGTLSCRSDCLFETRDCHF